MKLRDLGGMDMNKMRRTTAIRRVVESDMGLLASSMVLLYRWSGVSEAARRVATKEGARAVLEARMEVERDTHDFLLRHP